MHKHGFRDRGVYTATTITLHGDHIVCRYHCQVKNIEKALPVLEELCLCGNGIDHLESSIEGFSKLRVSCQSIPLKIIFSS